MRRAHNKKDLTGQTFGELTVIAEAGRTAAQKTKWLCRCSCGKEHVVVGGSLLSGHTTSCGCSYIRKPRNFKHGHSHRNGQRHFTRAYAAWSHMKQRCDNPNVAQFADYGGRGISYDPRWSEFENFLADMGEPPEGMTLDRRNNNLGYFKGNCHWASRIEQTRNQRSNIPITFHGETRNLSAWAEILGLNYATLYWRIVTRGWPSEKALTTKHYDSHGNIKH